jgi:hypothetical protein
MILLLRPGPGRLRLRLAGSLCVGGSAQADARHAAPRRLYLPFSACVAVAAPFV